VDLPRYLRRHVPPDRRYAEEAQIVERQPLSSTKWRRRRTRIILIRTDTAILERDLATAPNDRFCSSPLVLLWGVSAAQTGGYALRSPMLTSVRHVP
jgi:hypothetical protein